MMIMVILAIPTVPSLILSMYHPKMSHGNFQHRTTFVLIHPGTRGNQKMATTITMKALPCDLSVQSVARLTSTNQS